MSIDVQLINILNSLAGRTPFLDSIIIFFASYLAYILIALCVVWAITLRSELREKIIILVVTGGASVVSRYGVTELIRFFIHRPRPFVDLPVQQLLTSNEWSFPSGHAAFFFAMATAVYLYDKKWGVWFYIAAALMTVSRVIAGIHYPSDIVGGAIVGGVVAYAAYSIARRLNHGQNTLVATH